MDNSVNEPSIGSLIADLTDQSSQLVRKEAELIKAELSTKLAQVKSALVMLVLGAAGLIVGLFYILDAVVYGLAEVLPPDLGPWLAALLVGLIAGGIGYAAIKKGEQQLTPSSLVPERTMQALSKDKRLIEEQVQ